MGWIKHSSKPAAPPRPRTALRSEGICLPLALQQRIADLLVKHQRFAYTQGHLRLHIVASTPHHDGGTDYAVRTAVRDDNGREHVFTSHVRLHPTQHLRLIR